MSRGGWILAVATAVVVLAVGTALVLIGPPNDARLVQLDERRVEDLRLLAGLVRSQWVIQHRLPAALATLPATIVAGHDRDPVTGEPYAYQRRPDSSFALGATFDRARGRDELEEYERPWAHGAGAWRYAFSMRLDGGAPDSSGPAAQRSR